MVHFKIHLPRKVFLIFRKIIFQVYVIDMFQNVTFTMVFLFKYRIIFVSTFNSVFFYYLISNNIKDNLTIIFPAEYSKYLRRVKNCLYPHCYTHCCFRILEKVQSFQKLDEVNFKDFIKRTKYLKE